MKAPFNQMKKGPPAVVLAGSFHSSHVQRAETKDQLQQWIKCLKQLYLVSGDHIDSSLLYVRRLRCDEF